MAQVPAEVATTKGATWKKVLWWCLGILGLLGTVAVVLCLLKRKGPITTAKDVVSKVQHEVDKIDIQAKAEAAEAAGVEAAVVTKIKEAAEIEDEKQRLDALAAALAEDY